MDGVALVPERLFEAFADALTLYVAAQVKRGAPVDHELLAYREAFAEGSEGVPNTGRAPVDTAGWPRVAQVAERLGVSTRRVCHLRSRGRLRGVRDHDGRTWLIEPESVEDYERTRRAA